jgi:hypothetical protein
MTALEGIVFAVIGAALAAAIIGAVAVAWRRVMSDDRPLPFFRMLERHGLGVDALERAAGPAGLAAAVRRCAVCGGRADCHAAFAAGHPEKAGPDCPNAGLFKRAAHR